MAISMIVSLYTTRVVLESLGVSDYGIYNVITGFVTMLASVNGAMVAVTRRFLTISIANDTLERQRETFSISFYIHLGIAILLVALAATFGFWFIKNKMVLPIDMLSTAKWVFIFSLFSVLSLCATVPHNALVIANERMGIFSMLSMIEVVFKLLVALTISKFEGNRLLLYSLFISIIAVLIRILYVVYCHLNFNNVNYKFVKNRALYKTIFVFAGYNTYMVTALSAYQQGINILLNVFFNPIVNAARAISVQVQGLAIMLATNFQQAVDPQITKSYAIGDLNRMHSLIFKSTKFTYILVFVVIFPIIIETESIFRLWLVDIPEFAIIFTQFSLIIVLFDVITNPLTTSVFATGKIKKYQIVVATYLLSIIIVIYLTLKLGINPIGVYVINTLMIVILYIIKLLMAVPIVNINLSDYFRVTILPMLFFTILSLLSYLAFHYLIHPSSFVNILVSIIIVLFSALVCGLTKTEKKYIVNIIKLKYVRK